MIRRVNQNIEVTHVAARVILFIERGDERMEVPIGIVDEIGIDNIQRDVLRNAALRAPLIEIALQRLLITCNRCRQPARHSVGIRSLS